MVVYDMDDPQLNHEEEVQEESGFIMDKTNDLIPNGLLKPHPVEWKGQPQTPPLEKRGLPGEVTITDSAGVRKRRKIDKRQAKALQYMMEGYSKSHALRKAGYSSSYSNVPKNFMESTMIQSVLTTVQDKLVDKGITPDFIAGKFFEWLNAKKIERDRKGEELEKPDYTTQLAAVKEWKDLMRNHGNKPAGQVTEKITLERFLGAEDDEENA